MMENIKFAILVYRLKTPMHYFLGYVKNLLKTRLTLASFQLRIKGRSVATPPKPLTVDSAKKRRF
jgi:hypothetical protein